MLPLLSLLLRLSFPFTLAALLAAQDAAPAPDRREGEGEGPYDRLILRGAMVIDGTGAPPRGPLDVTIQKNRISAVGGPPNAPAAEYVYKLWLAHGVTTVRGEALGSQAWTAGEKARSDHNEIVAPRIFDYQRPNVHSAGVCCGR